MKQINQLQEKNKKLETKLHKYQQTVFFPFFLLSIIVIYTLCRVFHIDDSIYTPLIKVVPNSIICTIMGGFVTGSMVLACKLEYKKSIQKIKKQIKNNQKIINLYLQKNKQNKKINSEEKTKDLSKINQLENQIIENYSLEMIPNIELDQIEKSIMKTKGR